MDNTSKKPSSRQLDLRPTGKRPRSDSWRSERYQSKPREIAYVTRGVSDYFGSACHDRSYTVTWKPFALAAGATDVRAKQVVFDTSLLAGQSVPFSGEFVDHLVGVAAHESGHATIAQSHGWPVIHDALFTSIRNIIEDMAIDNGPMRSENAGLADLTRSLRLGMQAQQREVIGQMWRDAPSGLGAMDLLNLWGCARLFLCPEVLTLESKRKSELATIALLDPIGDRVMGASCQLSSEESKSLITTACAEVRAILVGYEFEQQERQEKRDQEKQAQVASDSASDDRDPSSDSINDSDSDDSNDQSDESPTEAPSTGKSQSEDASDRSEDAKAPSKASDSQSQQSDWPYDGPMPSNCPSKPDPDSNPYSDPKLWNQVKRELESLEATRPAVKGSRDAMRTLAPYTNRVTVAKITASYQELASEPLRRRRLDSGKIDRKRIAFADSRSDIFAQQANRQLDGTLVLVMDLSGSMAQGPDVLAKQTAASVYVALKPTPIDCYIYSYGEPNVCQLATPTRVIDFDTIDADGGTPTAEAIARVLEDIKPRGQSVILHVTDGTPDNQEEALKQFKLARQRGWLVINVIVGNYLVDIRYDRWKRELASVSDSLQSLSRFDELPAVIASAVGDIVKGSKRKL